MMDFLLLLLKIRSQRTPQDIEDSIVDCRTLSVFFRIDGFFFFFIIVSAENAVLHKYIVQNSRSMLGAISEIVGNSVLILSPNLLNDFF